MISEYLKHDIEVYASELRRSSRLLQLARLGEVTAEAMAVYVANLRLLVRETEVNLRLAQRRATELGRSDLATFFAHKRDEELGHERWADDDMDRLKSQFAAKASDEDSPAISGLLDYLRTAIEDEPYRYLAYMLLAEYVTVLVGPELLALLEGRCGIPSASLTVIGRHAELDREHTSEGLRQIDDAVVDMSYLGVMRETIRTSMGYFNSFWNEICSIARPTEPARAVA